MLNLETLPQRVFERTSTIVGLGSLASVIYREGIYYPDYVVPNYQDTTDPTLKIGTEEDFADIGTSRIDTWSMNDASNTGYRTAVYRVDDSKDMPWIVRGTALSTQPEGTINATMARLLMSQGFNVITIGPEVGSSLPQSQSAYNMHVILSEYEKLGEMDTQEVFYEGFSRGANIGLGFQLYQDQFKREVISSHLTDLALALPVSLDRQGVKKAANFPREIASLGLSVLKVLPELPDRPNVLETFDVSFSGLKQFYRTLIPLLSGEAGMMAARLQPDTKAIIAFYGLCSWNDRKVYQDILRNHTKISYVHPRGGHGRGVTIRSCEAIARPFGAVKKQLLEGVAICDVDLKNDLAIAV